MPNRSCGTGWTMLGGRPRNSSWRGANGTSSRTRFGSFAEQAAKADELVDEAAAAGGGSHPVTVHAKMLRVSS